LSKDAPSSGDPDEEATIMYEKKSKPTAKFMKKAGLKISLGDDEEDSDEKEKKKEKVEPED
jgi:hypothetical protein